MSEQVRWFKTKHGRIYKVLSDGTATLTFQGTPCYSSGDPIDLDYCLKNFVECTEFGDPLPDAAKKPICDIAFCTPEKNPSHYVPGGHVDVRQKDGPMRNHHRVECQCEQCYLPDAAKPSEQTNSVRRESDSVDCEVKVGVGEAPDTSRLPPGHAVGSQAEGSDITDILTTLCGDIKIPTSLRRTLAGHIRGYITRLEGELRGTTKEKNVTYECLKSSEHTLARVVKERDAAVQQLAERDAEIERWKEQAFRPLGDNHHNAALCPYCREQAESELARTQLVAAQEKIERLINGAECKFCGKTIVEKGTCSECEPCIESQLHTQLADERRGRENDWKHFHHESRFPAQPASTPGQQANAGS